MKILSIISVGGRLIKLMGVCLVVMLAFNACDIAYSIPLRNNEHFYDFALSDSNRVRLSCMYFHGFYYLNFNLKGEYVLNPDSFKMMTYDENIKVMKSNVNYEGDYIKKNNTIVKNVSITRWIIFEQKDKSREIQSPLVVYVLPSGFIMYNGHRVITDSLRIVLKKPENTGVFSNFLRRRVHSD